ncbi:MAG: hypothetical protein JWQ57_3811 [Mucilaginibacter sp.]|nr:hypothetical protein [Mucilaginibacter sp.]
MTRNNNMFKIIGISACVLLVFIGAVSVATRYHAGFAPPVKKAPAVAIEPAPKRYDEALLKKLGDILKGMDSSAPLFTLKGTINQVDNVDTAARMDHVPFVICKAGNELYYKMGEQETINQDGYCMQIDARSQRIFLEKQKRINAMGLPNADVLTRAMQSEGYELNIKKSGKYGTITMLNERNVYCKEYAVTYDTVTNKVTRMYSRLANPDEPANVQKTKIIEIGVADYAMKADLKDYTAISSVIDKKHNLKAGYQAFKLTELH